MKYVKYLSAFALGMVVLSSCTDDFVDTFNTVEKPNTLAQLEYLNAYAPLKEALRGSMSRSVNPNFLLGTGVTASEYNQKGGVYALTNTNFDQVTAGNAMKYASVVNDKGEMNFATVTEFVNNATAAGLQVYGHTLCWHSQQNVKWLNSLIADKEIPVDPNAANNYLRYTCNDPGANSWDKQAIYTMPVSMEQGKTYTVSVRVKGSTDSGENKLGLWPIWSTSSNKNEWGGSNDVQYLAEHEFDDNWDTYTWNFEAAFPHDQLQFVFGKHGGFVGFDDLQVIDEATGENLFDPMDFEDGKANGWGNNWQGPSYAVELESAGPVSFTVIESLINGGDAEDGETSSLVSRYPDNGGDISAPVVDDPAGTGKVFKSDINGNPSEAWDSQFFIEFNEPLEAGEKISVSFRYRCDDTRNIDTQAHGAPGDYHHWAFIGTLNATPEWKEHSWSGKIDSGQAGSNGCKSIAFNLSSADSPSTFYIDDVKVEIERTYTGNTIPMTAEEKAEALTNEMERWIKGMMEATEGKVKAWDVVNEAISGGPWGQKYDLQHGDPSNKTDFFWQDYLGDNFVRVPVKFARQYFAEQEGANPEDLKLFINDYNLESDWDDNQKLKSLIQWIEQWESDGETKIDGIGTQMHISYQMNPATQASKEEHIVKMFELMAATGKLCRITELDMGICDEEGKAIKTADVTFEQQKLMAKYYNFVISKYFEIIPEAQQYGICQWAQTDSPEGSGWRGGEPIGLWDLNYTRKPTYGGFADGLMGRPTE